VIVAFRQHDARECANRLLDHVAAGREHRPLGVGERFAARVVDQLERDHRGAVRYDNVGQLARLDAHVRAHHGIAVPVVGNDVVRALGQQHHVAGHDVLRDRPAFSRVELAAWDNFE